MSKIIATSHTHTKSKHGIKSFLSWFQSESVTHRVRLIAGRFTNLRRLSSWPLLAAFLITPWLSWNDHPMVHLDLVTKEFRFGTIIFWPEDLMILIWMMMTGAFGLFFVAMASGRLWCGFSCPQTIWTFLFIRLEELIEGSRHKRLRMDNTKIVFNKTIFNKAIREKIIRKLIKHSAWLTLSLITGITFISYFYPLSNMAKDFLANDFLFGDMSGSGLFWIILIGGFTYLNAGFLREQVCIHMCPYSRFQSVMADKSTLTVQYNEQRDDCIDCEVCVQVCPTGIDIRHGIQLACIACGACVDGCNDIMEKINKPKGLISFRPAETDMKQAFNIIKRPRLLGYAIAFLLSLTLLFFQGINNEHINSSLERDRNTLYRVNSNDEIENNYSLKLHNKKNELMKIKLLIKGNSKDLFRINRKYYKIEPRERQQFPFTITQLEPEEKHTFTEKYKKEIIVDIVSIDSGELLGSIKTSFIAPHQE